MKYLRKLAAWYLSRGSVYVYNYDCVTKIHDKYMICGKDWVIRYGKEGWR